MNLLELGRSGLKVPPLCFGANVFGWTVDESQSFKLLDAALDAGINFIDTAEVYSRWVPGHHGGESEAILGRWFAERGCRDRVVLATKVGADMGEGRKGLSSKRIREAVEGSLRRLRTDYIDLYQSHTDDPDTPLQETLETFQELIQAGKVRAIGASNYSAQRLSEAVELSARTGLPQYQSLQPLYNLVERESFESSLAPVCLEHGIGVIPFYALASGFLTGKYRSTEDLAGRIRGNRVSSYLNEHGLRVLAAIDHVASRYGVRQASVALAWLMQRPTVTAPIVSATSTEQLQDILAARELTLDSDSMEILNEASFVT